MKHTMRGCFSFGNKRRYFKGHCNTGAPVVCHTAPRAVCMVSTLDRYFKVLFSAITNLCKGGCMQKSPHLPGLTIAHAIEHRILLRYSGQITSYFLDGVGDFAKSNWFLNATLRTEGSVGANAGDYSAIVLDEAGIVYAGSMQAQDYSPSNDSNWGAGIGSSSISVWIQ